MDGKLVADIKERLDAAHKVLIVSHIRPDGDAIGSLLALGLALQNAGKSVQMVLTDGVPSNFRHLPGSEQVRTAPEGHFDLTITVDCSDFKRTGKALEAYGQPDIVIDHHITNDGFGTLNLIEPESAATASLLTRCLPAWGLSITPPIAANLVTGFITDTLGFRTSNTTPEALRQVADLMEKGANLHSLYFQGLVARTFKAARYWGAGLTRLQHADGIVWATLTLADRQAIGYPDSDDADLINVVSAIGEADVSMIFVEQPRGTVKVSWRAQKPGMDVSQLARHFGGGGHPAASGADIPGGLAEVQERVLDTTRKAIITSKEMK